MTMPYTITATITQYLQAAAIAVLASIENRFDCFLQKWVAKFCHQLIHIATHPRTGNDICSQITSISLPHKADTFVAWILQSKIDMYI